MKIYGADLTAADVAEGSSITNLTVPSGTSFPGTPNAGELFFRTDMTTLYVHDGSTWNSLSGGSGTVTSVAVSGTTNRITSSGSPITTSGTITLDIASTYVGQSSITTLGTVTTGVWNGTAIGTAYETAAGSSGQIQFSDGTTFAADAGLSYVGSTTQTLTIGTTSTGGTIKTPDNGSGSSTSLTISTGTETSGAGGKGKIIIKPGTNSGSASGPAMGNSTTVSGGDNSGSGNAGFGYLYGGSVTSTGTGSPGTAYIAGGNVLNSSNTSSGGAVNIFGGNPLEGNGGSINITASSGVTQTATAHDGGSITLKTGAGVSGGTNGSIIFQAGSTTYMTIGSSGNVTINAPSSGAAFTAIDLSYTHSTNVLILGSTTTNGIIKGGASTSTNGASITLQGGDPFNSTTGVGGTVFIKGGQLSGTNSSSGGITIPGNQPNGSGSSNGTITMSGINSSDTGPGPLSLAGGNATGSNINPGGNVTVQGGASTSSSGSSGGGNVTVQGGTTTGTNSAGSVTIQGGTATSNGTGGNVTVAGGTSGSGTAGNVIIKTASTTRLTIDNAGAASFSVSFGYGPSGNGTGGTITQTSSRTTGVTLNTICGAITLVSAAGGSGTFNTFTVTNSKVAATDTIIVNQKSGTDKYQTFVTAVNAGSFNISFATIASGNTTEQPVFNFAIIKSISS